ncbi:MAG: nucleotide exchange factor GrpE [Gammaproteobacteria bacterium]|nr:MAG: nucleotide exchange factor GrpE [Gammaproteobacteria bacterium]
MGEEKKQNDNQVEELKKYISTLEEKVKKLENLAKVSNERYLNLQRELEFLKDKHRRELEELKRYCLEKFAKDLLEVADNLERAIEHLRNNEGCKETFAGIEMIYGQLRRVFEKHGITPIEVEKFDHALCEAVSTVQTDEVEENTILEVVQKGYKLHDRILRPAKVVVAVKKEEAKEGKS